MQHSGDAAQPSRITWEMTMRVIAMRVVAIAVLFGLLGIAYWQGAIRAHAREDGYRLVLATSRIAEAKSAALRGEKVLAVYHAGAATALSDSVVVALAAGELFIDVQQPELARAELLRAKSMTTAEDKGLRAAIGAQEKRLAPIQPR